MIINHFKNKTISLSANNATMNMSGEFHNVKDFTFRCKITKSDQSKIAIDVLIKRFAKAISTQLKNSDVVSDFVNETEVFDTSQLLDLFNEGTGSLESLLSSVSVPENLKVLFAYPEFSFNAMSLECKKTNNNYSLEIGLDDFVMDFTIPFTIKTIKIKGWGSMLFSTNQSTKFKLILDEDSDQLKDLGFTFPYLGTINLDLSFFDLEFNDSTIKAKVGASIPESIKYPEFLEGYLNKNFFCSLVFTPKEIEITPSGLFSKNLIPVKFELGFPDFIDIFDLDKLTIFLDSIKFKIDNTTTKGIVFDLRIGLPPKLNDYLSSLEIKNVFKEYSGGEPTDENTFKLELTTSGSDLIGKLKTSPFSNSKIEIPNFSFGELTNTEEKLKYQFWYNEIIWDLNLGDFGQVYFSNPNFKKTSGSPKTSLEGSVVLVKPFAIPLGLIKRFCEKIGFGELANKIFPNDQFPNDQFPIIAKEGVTRNSYIINNLTKNNADKEKLQTLISEIKQLNNIYDKEIYLAKCNYILNNAEESNYSNELIVLFKSIIYNLNTYNYSTSYFKQQVEKAIEIANEEILKIEGPLDLSKMYTSSSIPFISDNFTSISPNEVPDRFLYFTKSKIPKKIEYLFNVNQKGNIGGYLRIPEGYPKAKFLVPSFPFVYGVELKEIGLSHLSSAKSALVEVDATIDHFNLLEFYATKILNNFFGLDFNSVISKLKATINLNKVTAVVPYAFPVPIPIFFKNLNFYRYGIEGFETNFNIQFPKPEADFLEIAEAVKDLVSFFTSEDKLFDPNGEALISNTRDNKLKITGGENYITLPYYLKNDATIGKKDELFSYDTWPLVASLLNFLKTGSPSHLINGIDIEDRVFKNEMKFLNFLDINGNAIITTQNELAIVRYLNLCLKLLLYYIKLSTNEKTSKDVQFTDVYKTIINNIDSLRGIDRSNETNSYTTFISLLNGRLDILKLLLKYLKYRNTLALQNIPISQITNDRDKLIVYLFGSFKMANSITFKCHLATTIGMHGQSTGFSISGKLVGFINLKLLGSIHLELPEVNSDNLLNINQFTMAGTGTANVMVFGKNTINGSILTGIVNGSPILQIKLSGDLFPTISPIQLTGDFSGTISSHYVELMGNAVLKIGDFTILSNSFTITHNEIFSKLELFGQSFSFKLTFKDPYIKLKTDLYASIELGGIKVGPSDTFGITLPEFAKINVSVALLSEIKQSDAATSVKFKLHAKGKFKFLAFDEIKVDHEFEVEVSLFSDIETEIIKKIKAIIVEKFKDFGDFFLNNLLKFGQELITGTFTIVSEKVEMVANFLLENTGHFYGDVEEGVCMLLSKANYTTTQTFEIFKDHGDIALRSSINFFTKAGHSLADITKNLFASGVTEVNKLGSLIAFYNGHDEATEALWKTASFTRKAIADFLRTNIYIEYTAKDVYLKIRNFTNTVDAYKLGEALWAYPNHEIAKAMKGYHWDKTIALFFKDYGDYDAATIKSILSQADFTDDAIKAALIGADFAINVIEDLWEDITDPLDNIDLNPLD